MGEETFAIFHYEAYEGQSVVFEGTLTECMEWLRNDRGRYQLDDLEIYQNTNLDIYELAKEC